MSYRQGLNLIAGSGATPYINSQTGNWEIGGIDTGIQAIQTKISVKEYDDLIKSGKYDNNKMYFITNTSPLLFVNKKILSANWSKITDTRYENVIPVEGITSTDIVMIDIASSLSDDAYIQSKSVLDEINIQRIRSAENSVVIVTSAPINTDISVDIVVTKCMIGE